MIQTISKQTRVFLSALAGAILALVVAGHCMADITLTVERTPDGTLMSYKMTVTPAGEPVPAMKYRFGVLPDETVPGNAVTHYLRSLGENWLNARWIKVQEQLGEEVYEWYGNEVPIKDIPLEKLEAFSETFDSYVTGFIEKATLCRDCDWGLEEEHLGTIEFMGTLLPSVQQTRQISRMLAIRARFAVAQGRYDDAVDHIRMNYQLAKTVSKMKFLVSGLVAIAEVGIGHGATLDLIAAPDSPNLYWTLAELPVPMVDLRDAVRLELGNGLRIIPGMRDIESAEHSAEEWGRLFKEYLSVHPIIQGLVGRERDDADALYLLAIPTYPSAKRRLIESGMKPETAESMAVGQVLLIDAKREYEKIAGHFEKILYTNADFPQMQRLLDAAESELRKSGFDAGTLTAGALLPAVANVSTAQYRIEWQRRGMQVIEAIRMHAAETGQLPRSLDDIDIVPVPENPLTNQPFLYRPDGDTGILEMPFSDGIPGFAQRFEIQLAG